MGSEVHALVLLDADTVGVIFPFVAGGRGGIEVDLHGCLHRKIVRQLDTFIIPDGIHGLLTLKQGGDPLGAGGLQQGHDHLGIDLFVGRVQQLIEHHNQSAHQQQNDGEEHQQTAADHSARGTGLLLLGFLFLGSRIFPLHHGSHAGIPGGTIGIHFIHDYSSS